VNHKAAIAILAEIDKGRPLDANELVAQIGKMNYFAISGGRGIKGQSSLLMPVHAGYWVTVTLDPSDTYTVRRIFCRAGKVFVKHEWTDVYCDEVGDVAYLASCHLDNYEVFDAVTA